MCTSSTEPWPRISTSRTASRGRTSTVAFATSSPAVASTVYCPGTSPTNFPSRTIPPAPGAWMVSSGT